MWKEYNAPLFEVKKEISVEISRNGGKYEQTLCNNRWSSGSLSYAPLRELIEETLSESFFDELAFMWTSTGQTNGERKTVIGDGDDFRALAALGGAHREPPFSPR